MKEPSYKEALEAFINPFHEFSAEPVTNGLINESYKITNRNTGESFLLQQINQHVFREPEKIQQNYVALWNYLKSERIPFFIPALKYFADNKLFYSDQHNRCWRVFAFIDGTKTLFTARNEKQAATVAETFAAFTACFRNFSAEQLHVTIPDFHNVSLRFYQFSQAAKCATKERVNKCKPLIEDLKAREKYANLYDVFTESDEFLLRVMHHDAKISNILFDIDSGKVVCPVDFDTAMPGYFFSDIGDMIRSMCCTEDENSSEFDNIQIRKGFYEAIISGYTDVLGEELTASERKYIHTTGLLVIYMQALRFLTDYLNNNIYYRISYPEQNYIRAINQITLLKSLEDFLSRNYNFRY